MLLINSILSCLEPDFICRSRASALSTLSVASSSSEIQELAKTGLREIAMVMLKSHGLRMDAVMYMLAALKLFSEESESRVKEITFQIAMLGRSGFDINNPDKTYTIHSMPGVFTGLQLVSYMYVGFKHFAPEQNVGVDLSSEYEAAVNLFKSGETK